MKSAIFAAAATIVSFASAQAFGGVPTCAQPCISSALGTVGCTPADVGCQCENTQQIAAAAGSCILGACTAPGDLQAAITGGAALCVNYSATAAAGGASSTAEPTTTLTSTVQSTTSVVVSATTSTSSSAVSTSTVTAETTDIPSPTPTVPVVVGTGTGVVTPVAPSSTVMVPVGAAGRNVAGAGALVGFLGAVLVL